MALLEALGAETWGRLRTLGVGDEGGRSATIALNPPAARALAAALRRVPALRALELRRVTLSDEAAAELFPASSADAVPLLRTLAVVKAGLTPAAARMLAATCWRLEALDLTSNPRLGAAGLAALLAAPTFALRRLDLVACDLDVSTLLSLANAPWPLEELDLSFNDFRGAAAGPALAALSRHRGLRRLKLSNCSLNAAGFKALVEATWPALTSLFASWAGVAFVGPHALGAAAFAGFPALEELALLSMELGEQGAALLASRRWACLRKLNLNACLLGDASIAALSRGMWPALQVLYLRGNYLHAAGLLSVANVPWPLEELDLAHNEFGAAVPALAALSRHAGMRKLNVGFCDLSAAGFKALVEAAWTALTDLDASLAAVALDGPHALGAAAFAGFPALEALRLERVELGEAGAALLASRRWARLKSLHLNHTELGDAGLAALARGAFPALERLNLEDNGLTAPLALDDARRWAPALAALRQ